MYKKLFTGAQFFVENKCKIIPAKDHYREMFDIVHEIEGCPPRLLSASRKFIRKFDVTVIKDNATSKMGDNLTLFIFNDCVEITKVSF